MWYNFLKYIIAEQSPQKEDIFMDKHYDVIIAGTGVGGLYTALCLPEGMNILVISKRELDLCNSALAQGGVAAVYKPVDDEVLFIPEELVEIREYATYIQETVKSKAEEILDMAKKISTQYPQRKDQYRFANEKMPQYTAAIMKALDYLCGKVPFTQVKQIVHKTLQPAPGE